MQLFLAAYDPSTEAKDGTYWAFRHSKIPIQVIRDFYNHVAVANLPTEPNELRATDVHGGFANVGDKWGCWYRFANGGRDAFGRPGRFVIWCAFFQWEDATGLDSSPVLLCKRIQSLVESSMSRPLPQPESLELELKLLPVGTSPQSLPVQSESIVLQGAQALAELGALVGLAPFGTHLRGEIGGSTNNLHVELTVQIASKLRPSTTEDVPIDDFVHPIFAAAIESSPPDMTDARQSWNLPLAVGFAGIIAGLVTGYSFGRRPPNPVASNPSATASTSLTSHPQVLLVAKTQKEVRRIILTSPLTGSRAVKSGVFDSQSRPRSTPARFAFSMIDGNAITANGAAPRNLDLWSRLKPGEPVVVLPKSSDPDVDCRKSIQSLFRDEAVILVGNLEVLVEDDPIGGQR